MKSTRVMLAGSAATAVLLTAGVVGVANAASTTSTTGTVGASGIPRTVFHDERLNAVASVLNTSTSNVQTARKNHTVSTLISNAGLSKQTFRTKVKAALTSDLQAKGYTSSQVTIALQQREIHALKHRDV